MKKNKNGFVLFETLVVATFVLGALVFLFVQFSNIKNNYEITFKYNTVPGLYNSKILSKHISDSSFYTIFQSNLNTEGRRGYFFISKEYVEDGTTKTLTCSENGGSDFCNEIIEKINAKRVILLADNIENFQTDLKIMSNKKANKNDRLDYNGFDEEFKEFLLSLDATTVTSSNRLAIEFNDNTFAVLAID